MYVAAMHGGTPCNDDAMMQSMFSEWFSVPLARGVRAGCPSRGFHE
jgi:hypothetical protein